MGRTNTTYYQALFRSLYIFDPEPVFVNVYGVQESIPRKRFRQSMHVARRAGTSNRVVVPARQAGNRFLRSLKALQIRAQCS